MGGVWLMRHRTDAVGGQAEERRGEAVRSLGCNAYAMRARIDQAERDLSAMRCAIALALALGAASMAVACAAVFAL